MPAVHPLWLPFAPRANTDRQAQRVASRQIPPGPVQQHDPDWARDFNGVRSLIASTIPDEVLDLRHVGSTAVPGLIAKPVIDLDLTVRDCEDESAYVPHLEAVGFRLIFRDAFGQDAHRQLTFADPNSNLHVWSIGALEPRRHAMFVDWLQSHPDDLRRYAQAKVAAIRSGRNYNDEKAPVVYDIYERVFAADPRHEHVPRPRTG